MHGCEAETPAVLNSASLHGLTLILFSCQSIARGVLWLVHYDFVVICMAYKIHTCSNNSNGLYIRKIIYEGITSV